VTPPFFADLPTTPGGFACVHADVPLRFHSNSRERPGRNAMRHYRCFDYPDFEKLPVADVVAKDAWLFLWVPGPWLVLGAHVPLVKAWGFKVSGMGFTWIKLNRNNTSALLFADFDLRMGPGLTTRKNAEFAVLGRRGKPKRLSASVLETIVAPIREHSRKPDEIYQRIEQFCAGPYLDLFARQRREGWTVYGDQTSRFDFEGPAQRAPLTYTREGTRT
jgi:N6-adenosine-specific RNA methylase IME4